MYVLKASLLTPTTIANSTENSEVILDTLISAGDCTAEKLAALINRPDVTGFFAHKLLKRTASQWNSDLFAKFLELYVKKFITKGTRSNSLRYTIMTLQLWIHFIGSADELKREDVKILLPRLKPIVVAFIKNWTIYESSAIALFKDIKSYFGDTYSPSSTFPGDKDAPFRFTFDDYIHQELRRYIFPFVGQILIELAIQENFYQKPTELLALATSKSFGDKDYASLYIRSIKDSFTLDDIEPFIREPGDKMEKFLLLNVRANNRFRNLCEDGPMDKVLSVVNNCVSYAGFNFVDNKAYRELSLEEKAVFIKPYSSKLESNSREKQHNLLRLWINDAEWNNPQRSTAELTQLALRNRHMFSFNGSWLFSEMMEILILREHRQEFEQAKVEYKDYLDKIAEGKFVYPADTPQDFQKPGLVLARIEVLRQKVYSWILEKERLEKGLWIDSHWTHVKEDLEVIFVEHLATCLAEYSTEDALEAVILANSSKIKTLVEILAEREDLNFKQIHILLKEVQYRSAKVDTPTKDLLQSKLTSWVNDVESDKDYLHAALFLFISHSEYFSFDGALASAFNRKSFSDLKVLLDTVLEINGKGNIEYDGLETRHFYNDKAKEALRIELLKHVEGHHDTKDQALLFCQYALFSGNYSNWSWFYGKYPLESMGELYISPLKTENLSHIFCNEVQKENLLSLWKATPFEQSSMQFIRDFIFKGGSYLHDHPGWIKLGLKGQLALFSSENRQDHERMLVSLKKDFQKLWEEEAWTVDQYLEEITRINPYHSDAFAALAVNLVKIA